jgi:methionine salvage enolase-phosphatase E1
MIKSEADKKYVTSKLKKLKFEKGYKSIFTGQVKTTLYSQALDKIYAWRKYGDDIE